MADWVEIGNIQILNFNANGGDLSEADFEGLVIDAVTVVNAQSGNKDAVAYRVNGITSDLSNVSSSPFAIDVPNVKHFSLGVGYSPDQNLNKWSVEGLGVSYSLGSFYSVNLSSENGLISQTPNKQLAYRPDTQIELIAVPNSGYKFTGWSGDTIGTTIHADTLTVTLDENKNIVANFSSTVGVKEIQNSFNYTIFPNPSTGIFRVESDQISKGTYSVYSINGAKLIQASVDGSFQFDLSNYEKGVYLFELKSNQGVDVKRIILN